MNICLICTTKKETIEDIKDKLACFSNLFNLGVLMEKLRDLAKYIKNLQQRGRRTN